MFSLALLLGLFLNVSNLSWAHTYLLTLKSGARAELGDESECLGFSGARLTYFREVQPQVLIPAQFFQPLNTSSHWLCCLFTQLQLCVAYSSAHSQQLEED